MNQTPPISPVVKLKLKELDDRRLLHDKSLKLASNKLQSLLDGEKENETISNGKNNELEGQPITFTKYLEEDSISDRLSSMISQLIPLHKNSVPVTLSSESISQIISVLNLTITIVQNQENLLNLLKLNSGITKEQYDVEKEILLRELEVMRLINDRQRNDEILRNLKKRRRFSEPSSKGTMPRRKLRAGKSSVQEEGVETDDTISDVDEPKGDEEDDKKDQQSIINKNKLKRDEEYNKLLSEINNNEKLFIHNKFGYYYNTLNDERNSLRRKRKLDKNLNQK